MNETGFILGAAAYFITFMRVVANSISNGKMLQLANSTTIKFTSAIVIAVFFFSAIDSVQKNIPVIITGIFYVAALAEPMNDLIAAQMFDQRYDCCPYPLGYRCSA